MAGTLSVSEENDNICLYELERDSRKKALHDAVQRNLVAAGFSDAAALRSAFSGESSARPGEDLSLKTRKPRRKKGDSVGGVVTFRRTTRQSALVAKPAFPTVLDSIQKRKEEFKSWPGKPYLKKQEEDMKKSSGSLKHKVRLSPDPALDMDTEEEGRQSPCSPTSRKRPSSNTPERPPAVFEDDLQVIVAPRQEREPHGLPRPPPSGYHLERNDRRIPEDWRQEYATAYGHSDGGPYKGSSSRPWSPPYGAMREYDRRPLHYDGRGMPYEGRPEYVDRRDSYFDNRRRDFDRRDREYEEGRRYEEGRYERRAPPSDLYAVAAPVSGGSQYPMSSTLGTSPAPSSSVIIENEVKSIVKAKRPLHVDKYGDPTGAMTALFNGDINAFVKDLDPHVGWEGQTKEARQRLIGRLLDEYEVQGESNRFSEKYVKKQAGAALTQYRFSLNQYIDKGCARPSDLSKTIWDDMVEKRKRKEGKEMSERMASIARGRGSRGTMKKAVRESVIVFLTRHLKRDPYVTEIDDAFEREWNAVQEEQAEKRRKRTTSSTITMGPTTAESILKRLDILESFMQKWGPELESWKKHKSDPSKELTAPSRDIPKSADANEVAIVFTGDENDHVQGVEDKREDSSDESEDNDNSKSSDSEDDDSNTGKDQSDEDIVIANAVDVQEALDSDKEITEIGKKKKLAADANESVGQGKAVNDVHESCAAGSRKVISEASNAQRKSKAAGMVKQSNQTAETTLGTSSEKKDVSMPTQKEKENTVRSSKRQKTEGNSVGEPLVIQENEEVQTLTKQEEIGRNSKPMRRNVKAGDGKVQKASDGKVLKPADGKVQKAGKKLK